MTSTALLQKQASTPEASCPCSITL